MLYPHIEEEPLSAGKALSTLALFNILSVPLILFTLFTTSLITANVSAKRLIPYFLAEEVEGIDAPTGTMQTVGTLDGDLEVWYNTELQIRGVLRIIQREFFLFINENICYDPSLEPS